MFSRSAAAGMLACILAAGCASARGAANGVAAPRRDSVVAPRNIIDVPFYAQTENQCGPAALAMALAWSGVDVGADALTAELYTPKRRGTLQPDLIASARRHGRAAYVIHGFDELHSELEAGHPVVVLQNLALRWIPMWHYAVVIGRDPTSGAFVMHTGKQQAREIGPVTFMNTWQRAGAWGLLVMPPNELPATADEQRWLEAAVGLEKAGSLPGATDAYRAALARWPESLTASIGLANTLYAAGKPADAEHVLRGAVEAHPDSAAAWNNLAQVLHDLGRANDARRAARKAVDLGGDDSDVYRQTLSDVDAR